MKLMAALAIILTAVFVGLVGGKDGADSKFAKDYPWFYKNLAFFGLKVQGKQRFG